MNVSAPPGSVAGAPAPALTSHASTSPSPVAPPANGRRTPPLAKAETGGAGRARAAVLPWYLRPHTAGVEAALAADAARRDAPDSRAAAPSSAGMVRRRYVVLSSLHPTGRAVLTGELVLDTIADGRVMRVALRQVLPLTAGEAEHTDGELVLSATHLRSPRQAALRGRMWAAARKEARGEWRSAFRPCRAETTSTWSLLAGALPALRAAASPPEVGLWEDLELLHQGCRLARSSVPDLTLPGGKAADVWVLAGPTVPPRALVLDAEGEPLAFASTGRCYLRVAA